MNEVMNIQIYTAIAMAFLTLVLVGITLYYAIINKKILDENKKINDELLRPYVYASIYSKDTYIQLSIQNVGQRAAKSVKIKFNPDLSFIEKTSKPHPNGLGDVTNNHKPMLTQNFFPPGFRLNTILVYNPNFFEVHDAPRQFDVCCTYKDLNDKEYVENYRISLDSIVFGKKTAEFSDEYFWRELYKKLDALNKTFK